MKRFSMSVTILFLCCSNIQALKSFEINYLEWCHQSGYLAGGLGILASLRQNGKNALFTELTCALIIHHSECIRENPIISSYTMCTILASIEILCGSRLNACYNMCKTAHYFYTSDYTCSGRPASIRREDAIKALSFALQCFDIDHTFTASLEQEVLRRRALKRASIPTSSIKLEHQEYLDTVFVVEQGSAFQPKQQKPPHQTIDL